jgi:outer membrane receptor for monomeric catechols
MKTSSFKPWRLVPWFLIVPASLLAQPVTDEAPIDDDEVVELSPFEVTGDSDVGYQATSTLAGTRLRTDLRDIGSSISIVNEEFLTDTGSTNLEDVLIFTPNTEVGGLGGNFSGSQGANPIPEQQRDNPSGGITRVRGLAGADLTRNYFLTAVPFDTFNTDRIDVQRGANSALFGLGSPGGIVNASTIRADFLGNRGRLRFETDQYGTMRYSMRYNHMINDNIAVRIAGLSENKEYEQKQAFGNDDRLFVATTIKMPLGLTVRASAEIGETHSARPDYVPPNDGITPWINMGKPVFGTPAEAGSYYRTEGDILPGHFNHRFLTLAVSGVSSGFARFYQDPSNPEPTWGGPAFYRNGRGLPAPFPNTGEWMMLMPRPENIIIRLTGHRSDGTPVDPGTAPFWSNGFVSTQITDRSVFDYRKNLFNGGTAQQGSDWEIYNASIEGSYFDNRLGFEVSYSEESFNSWGNNSVQGVYQRMIYIDPNQYLLSTTDGTGTGPLVPNPNYGRPVVGGGSGGNDLTNDRDAFRIQAYYELRFDDFMDESSWLTKLLGTFTLTGLMDESVHYSKQAYSEGDTLDLRDISGILGDGFNNRYDRRSGQQFALPVTNDMNFLNANSISDLAGAGIQGVSFGRQRSHVGGGQYGTFSMWHNDASDPSNNGFQTYSGRIYTLWDDKYNYPASFFSSKRVTEVESEVLVGQHSLWDNTVVLTGTWRSDKASSATSSAPGVPGIPRMEQTYDPAYVAGPYANRPFPVTADDETTSWSIMVHTPEFIREKLPGGLNLSVYKSKADNFVPSGNNVNIFNEIVGAESGKTEEMGFIIEGLDGKLSARFNFFETSAVNDRFEETALYASESILLNLAHQLNNPANVSQGFTAADVQAVLPPQGVQDVNGFQVDWNNPDAATTNRNSSDTGTQDFTADGMEIEIAYNPIPEWTLLLTVGQQETVTSNTYPKMKEYVASHVLPQWVNSSFAQNYFIDATATQTLAARAQEQIVENVQRASLQDGNPAKEQAEWRWAFNTSYNFGSDSEIIPNWLGDFTIGGGIRWQDQVGIGFAVAQNSLGDYALDVNQPYYADSTLFVDVFARMHYKLKNDRAFTFQVNIKDLTDNSDLVPYVANPDGSEYYRILEGRLISASATFEF